MIGRGAVGRVYRATQICLDREVAIKILHPGYVNHAEAVTRFKLEACAVSRLQHPGIVTVFDWGHDGDGLYYLAIEYMPGVDLFDIAQKEAPIASARIARLMEQVARALGHAHAQGVIHRDLKPENLRVIEDAYAAGGSREIVKIYDFGIARVAQAAAAGCTQIGALVGTPYYMSPEQAAAQPVSPESDIYACGVIMYLLATGHLPFVAASPIEVASMHIRELPPSPSQLNPHIDPRLERIILRCLAKTPDARPRAGADLAAMLSDVGRRDPSEQSVPLHRAASLAVAASGGTARALRTRALPWTAAWAIGATSALGTILADAWLHGPWQPALTDARACVSPATSADIAQRTHVDTPNPQVEPSARTAGLATGVPVEPPRRTTGSPPSSPVF
jgi:serine/threonine protein kinase